MVDAVVVLVCFAFFSCSVHGQDDSEREALIYESDNFKEGIKNSRSFVMFFAPWCGHCKNLAPTWNELAKKYNNPENNNVIIAKVDCTVQKALCAEQGIVGFPTLKLFSIGGDQHKRYVGKRDLESLNKFLDEEILGIKSPDSVEKEHIHDSPGGTKSPESQDSKGSAIVLTDANFDEHVKNGHFFIKFYAPWCFHCKKLEPVWNDLAQLFNLDNSHKVTIAKVDCTVNKLQCQKYGITGYPSLFWFENGEKIEKYQGHRGIEDFQRYISKKLTPAQPEIDEQTLKTEEEAPKQSFVKMLTDTNFESHLLSTEIVFVKFYVTWCGPCRLFAPTWTKLAEKLSTGPISIAEVDCTANEKTCKNNKVDSYPTLNLYIKGEFVKKIPGYHDVNHMHNLLSSEIKLHDELRDKVKEEPHDELRDKVKEEPQDELHDKVQDEVHDELQDKVQDEVRDEL